MVAVFYIQLVIGFLLSGLIAFGAYRRRSLSRSGMWGTFILGGIVFGLAGWRWGLLLVLFFVSSTLLSHYKEKEKAAVAAEKFAKGHQRDIGQVLANGGVGAAAAVLAWLFPAWPWFPLYLGAMATVTADTWATELGTLSRQRPRLITNGQHVPTGTSGGVSPLGTAVSFGGGLFIGLAAALFGLGPLLPIALAAGLGGLAGSLFDSFLGATVQQIYKCRVCGKETEKVRHHGELTEPIRGWSWLNNDWVNGLASLVGGLTTVLLYMLLYF